MKIFGFMFGGNEAIAAEIQSPVAMDSQCPTCKSYLEHSRERITLEGQTFCKNSCVPPSIAAAEATAKSERIMADQKKRDDQAQGEQARYARLQESEDWIRENFALLQEHGLSPAIRLRELHKVLHPNDRMFLPTGSTMIARRVGNEVLIAQPE